MSAPDKKVMLGVPTPLVHIPNPPQVVCVASSVTFVVASAVEITFAALVSIISCNGSVIQFPVRPRGAEVSTTRLDP